MNILILEATTEQQTGEYIHIAPLMAPARVSNLQQPASASTLADPKAASVDKYIAY